MSQARQLISPKEARFPLFAGIDLGDRQINIALVDDLGRPLAWLSIDTEPGRGAEDGAARMASGVQQAARRAGVQIAQVARVGLASCGILDIPAGMLIQSPCLAGWDRSPLRDRVGHHCSLPVTINSDVNAATYGEFWVGAGRGFHNVVLVTLGATVGCGVIVEDNVLGGQHSHGAERGHLVIQDAADARMCGCGHRGHLEAYTSSSAVVDRAREALDAGRGSSLGRRLAAGDTLTPDVVAEEAAAGDELSLDIILGAGRFLAVGVVNLVHTVDPDIVLVGGSMTFGGKDSPLGRQFLQSVRDEFIRRVFPFLSTRTKIELAGLGGDAGAIGAAGLARLDYLKSRR